MILVEAFQITNEIIRHWCCDMPCILNTATKRQLDWIGQIARMPETTVQKRLFMSWTNHPRKTGRPQISPRNTYAQAIHCIIPLCDPVAGIAKTWITTAKNKKDWRSKIRSWWKWNAEQALWHNLPSMELMNTIISM
jgi:hypothetical protein